MESWWEKGFDELEELTRKGRTDLISSKVTKLTWNKQASTKQISIKATAGNIKPETEEIKCGKDGECILNPFMIKMKNQRWNN